MNTSHFLSFVLAGFVPAGDEKPFRQFMSLSSPTDAAPTLNVCILGTAWSCGLVTVCFDQHPNSPLGTLANGGTQGNLWKPALKHAQWHILRAWGHLRKRLLQHAVSMPQRSLCCLRRREAKDNLTKLLELKSYPMFAAEKNSLKQD